jgi:DUF4097 and DUF4098 domain-containing protein YvlB
MRRLRLCLLLALPAPLAAQITLPGTFAAAGDVSMRVWLPAGTVRVEAWERDSIRVAGRLAKGARFYGAGGLRGAKIGVDNLDPGNRNLPRADLVVTVPRKAHLWVKMTDGAVVATGTGGELEIITVSGTITVRDAAGVVSVETIDAAVTLTGITGEVRVRGGGGRISLAQIHGTLTAASVSGAIELSGSPMGDARIETIGGPIAVRGTVARGALLDLETHSGPIGLLLARGAVPALELSSRAGKVSNGAGAGTIEAGRITARSFKGDINATASSGITVTKPLPPPI